MNDEGHRKVPSTEGRNHAATVTEALIETPVGVVTSQCERGTVDGSRVTDVYAALAYYFDHREEIDRSLEASKAFVAELRERNSSFLERKLKAIRGD